VEDLFNGGLFVTGVELEPEAIKIDGLVFEVDEEFLRHPNGMFVVGLNAVLDVNQFVHDKCSENGESDLKDGLE
jgi:hypothetical protein